MVEADNRGAGSSCRPTQIVIASKIYGKGCDINRSLYRFRGPYILPQGGVGLPTYIWQTVLPLSVKVF